MVGTLYTFPLFFAPPLSQDQPTVQHVLTCFGHGAEYLDVYAAEFWSLATRVHKIQAPGYTLASTRIFQAPPCHARRDQSEVVVFSPYSTMSLLRSSVRTFSPLRRTLFTTAVRRDHFLDASPEVSGVASVADGSNLRLVPKTVETASLCWSTSMLSE